MDRTIYTDIKLLVLDNVIPVKLRSYVYGTTCLPREKDFLRCYFRYVSHNIDNVRLDCNTLVGDVTMLNTVMGNELQSYLEHVNDPKIELERLLNVKPLVYHGVMVGLENTGIEMIPSTRA